MEQKLTLLMSQKEGALSARLIKEMMPKYISPELESSINQASIDLPITEEVYRLEHVFLPQQGEKVRDILKLVKHNVHDLEKELLRDHTYIVRLKGPTNLPQSLYGYANPKSSTGRIDTHVRLIADGVARYDCVPKGWGGELWLFIQPKSFHLKIKLGMSFNQLRFFTRDTRFSEAELELAMAKHKLMWWPQKDKEIPYEEVKISDRDGGLILLLDLESDIIGYKGIKTGTPLDLSRTDNDPKEFFEKIDCPKSGMVKLLRDEFYILSTNERVRVPTSLACEMVPMDERAGEFRSHYAGFIDPGWGYGTKGETYGRQLTLEVRPFEDIVVRKGQPIAKIRFEHMVEETITYDGSGSNYVTQVGPTLGKFFAKW